MRGIPFSAVAKARHCGGTFAFTLPGGYGGSQKLVCGDPVKTKAETAEVPELYSEPTFHLALSLSPGHMLAVACSLTPSPHHGDCSLRKSSVTAVSFSSRCEMALCHQHAVCICPHRAETKVVCSAVMDENTWDPLSVLSGIMVY